MTQGPRPCPICGRPVEARWRPFCSRGCADIDLLRWLNERYRIPAQPDPSQIDSDGPERLPDEPV